MIPADNAKHMNLQMDKLSATGLVRAYRRRELSPVEVAQAVLQRIEQLNPHYNAFCLVDADEALRSAMRSEERWQKNEPLSFIDGVPATIKDLVLTRGWPTLRGSRTVDASQSWDEDAPQLSGCGKQALSCWGKQRPPNSVGKVCVIPL